jgi:hypothetical protein
MQNLLADMTAACDAIFPMEAPDSLVSAEVRLQALPSCLQDVVSKGSGLGLILLHGGASVHVKGRLSSFSFVCAFLKMCLLFCAFFFILCSFTCFQACVL